LAKEPELRYQQASDIKTQVETIATSPKPAEPAEKQAEGVWQSLKAGVPRVELDRWKERAPGWRIRCQTCGFTEHFGKYGIRRAAAGKKWTLGHCERCGRIRRHVIEKGPVPTEQSPLVPATSSAQPPRLSRAAIVGAVWAVFGLIGLLLLFTV